MTVAVNRFNFPMLKFHDFSKMLIAMVLMSSCKKID